MAWCRCGCPLVRDTGSGASEQTAFWAALRPCTRTHPLCLAAEALRYASEGFRNNRDLVIEAVQENAEYEARLRIYRLSQQYKVVNTSRGALRGVCRSNPQASGPQRELLAPHPGGFPGLPRRGYSLLGLAPGWPSVSGGHQGCGRRLGATGRHAAA